MLGLVSRWGDHSYLLAQMSQCLFSLNDPVAEHFALGLRAGVLHSSPPIHSVVSSCFFFCLCCSRVGVLTRARQSLPLSLALQTWMVEVGWGSNGSKNPQASEWRKQSLGAGEKHRTGAKRSGSQSKRNFLESLPCHVVAV